MTVLKAATSHQSDTCLDDSCRDVSRRSVYFSVGCAGGRIFGVVVPVPEAGAPSTIVVNRASGVARSMCPQ